MSSQITLLHFSDLHFGKGHRFNSDGGDAPTMSSLVNDFISQQQQPMMIAVTGDLINYDDQENKDKNFEQAFNFLRDICPKTGDGEIDSSKVFIVPGNHDVEYGSSDTTFEKYNEFYEKIHGKKPDLIELRVCDDPKVIIAEINSCSFVANDPKGYRGRVAKNAIEKLKKELDKQKKECQFDDYIKIALLHHHIVLLPPFIRKEDSGQDCNANIVNDTVVHDTDLISALYDYNFHLILHGHKHLPCQYVHDPISYTDKNDSKIPMLIIVGGSCGSRQLPDSIEIPCNTFNVLQIFWKEGEQITIKLTIKGIAIYGDDRQYVNVDKCCWETIKYREFRVQYQQTNKCEWKVSTSNKALDTSDALTYCLHNCLLSDSEFLSTVHPDQNYNIKELTVYHIATLKYKYIEAVLDTIEKEIGRSELNKIYKILNYYDISEILEKDLNSNIISAKQAIINFLEQYHDGK